MVLRKEWTLDVALHYTFTEKKCDSSLRYFHLLGGFSKPVGFLEDGLPGLVSSDRIIPHWFLSHERPYIRKGLFHNPPNLGGR